MNLTTKWDKIYDEIEGKTVRKKVFYVRGEESYARTVDITISHTTPVSEDYQGFSTDVTIQLYRHIGSSSILLYDGEELLTEIPTTQSTSSYTVDDLILSWGVEHQLYAVYKPNKQTLGAKTKRDIIYETIPPELVTEMEFIMPTTQIDEDDIDDISVAVLISPQVSGVPVKFYVDGELYDTVDASMGYAETSIESGLSKGIHTIKAMVDGSSTINEGSVSYQLLVGYDVLVTQYPSTFVNGENNTVKVRVKTLTGNVISGESVDYGRHTATTDSNGIATFTVTNASLVPTYAEYNSSVSNTIPVKTFTPTSVTVTKQYENIAPSVATSITVQVEGTSTNGGSLDGKSYPLKFKHSGSYVPSLEQNITFGSTNQKSTSYTGNKQGLLKADITIGGITSTPVDIYDNEICFYTYSKNMKIDSVSGGVSASESGGSYMIRNRSSGSVTLDAHQSTFEFDLYKYLNDTTSIRFAKGNNTSDAINITTFNNKRAKLVYSNDTVTVYAGTDVVTSFSASSSSKWAIRLHDVDTLILKNVRVYR